MSFQAVLRSIACMLLSAAVPARGAEFYVAPNGDDSNPGTLQRPWSTVQRAQTAVRKIAGREPVCVYLRGGVYYLGKTLLFTPADSGTRTCPVVYRAYGKGTPVLSGGRKLELKWQPYRDGILQAKVPAGLATDQIFVDGVRQPMARYPDFNPDERIYNGYAADAISPRRVARWNDPRGGFVHAMHEAEWGGFHYRITGKNADNTLQLEGGWQNNRPANMHPRFRFVENVFEELDAPREWFLDAKTATLYYFPPAGTDMARATVEAVVLHHLVEFRGSRESPVRFVAIEGVTFRHAARTFMENKEPLVRSDWTTYRGGAVFSHGAEDCRLENSWLDQVGGNAVFLSGYNRRWTVRGCRISQAGGNGVAMVGERSAARAPRDWHQRQELASVDRTPGPKSEDYPAECLVEDCLICQSGRVEKQTAPVQIELASGITVRHCSLYDVPRAGINIGDGCWGGHVIEFCDIFDTVKETGDHGSFNSWGRDRFWNLGGLDLNDDAAWAKQKGLVTLDAMRTVVLRNNRWRCDHGWDIDLDDGSTNYHIYNNLCLNGGLKNREGFYRVVENNVIVNNGFHPHCWYKHSQDVFRRNIVWSERYLPAGGMPATPWGKDLDSNLVHRPGLATPQPAAAMAAQSQRDAHSIVADARWIDPAKGDFRVRDDSPALKLGFVNFPMDRFGVQKPELKAIARTPDIPGLKPSKPSPQEPAAQVRHFLWEARVRDIAGLGDRSAFGLPGEYGVLIVQVPTGSLASRAGLRGNDVVIGCNGKPARNLSQIVSMQNAAAGRRLAMEVVRGQRRVAIDMADYAWVAIDSRSDARFAKIPLTQAALNAKLTTRPATVNEPLATLTDGLLAPNYGPVFPNAVADGIYKLDLGGPKSIAQVNTYSYNQNGNRGRQRFVLYAANSTTDPGWDVHDPRVFTPLAEVDTGTATADFTATSIRRAEGKPLGKYRWLLWATHPATPIAGGENTAFQEFQVTPAPPAQPSD